MCGLYLICFVLLLAASPAWKKGSVFAGKTREAASLPRLNSHHDLVSLSFCTFPKTTLYAGDLRNLFGFLEGQRNVSKTPFPPPQQDLVNCLVLLAPPQRNTFSRCLVGAQYGYIHASHFHVLLSPPQTSRL